MEKDINLSGGRITYAAVGHVPGNEYKFSHLGMLKALRAPELRQIINEIDPVKAFAGGGRDNRTTKKFDTETQLPYFSVTTNFKPAYAGTGRNTRTKTSGTAIQGATNLTVDFNLRREWGIQWAISDVMKEPGYFKYINGLIDGKVKPYGGVDGAKYGDKMLDIGMDIYRTVDETLLKPVDSVLTTSMVAGIGKNAAYPDEVTPTAAAPCVPVEVFDSAGKATENLLEAFQQTMLLNSLKGRLIVVGGQRLSKYMAKQGIMAVNNAGVNLAEAYAKLPVLWYFDPDVDTIYGENKIIAFDTAAAAFCPCPEHGENGFVNSGNWFDHSYGSLSFRVEQSALDSSIAGLGGDFFELDVDFRAQMAVSTKAYPTLDVTPSLLYGLYKRPTGFFTSVSGNILKDVTGIFGFELTTPA